MDAEVLREPARQLYRRGELLTLLSRCVSLGLAFLALGLLWSSPHVRPRGAVAVAIGYTLFLGAAWLWQHRRGRNRRLRLVHDFVDAAAVGAGAWFSGGLASPVWLLLYPHAVAVSVRGGLRYALGIGLVDAAIVGGLASVTPSEPAGALHAIAVLWCAFMGGTTSSHLKRVRAYLATANEALTRRSREQASLLRISRGILEGLELPETLPRVVRSLNELMGTHYCLLLLREGDRLRFAAQEGLEPEIVDAFRDLEIGESLTGLVAASGAPLAIADMRADPRMQFGGVVERFGYVSYLGVPLICEGDTLGTLEVVTKQVREFSPEEQALMLAFADQAAVAIHNAGLYERARATLEQVSEVNRRLEDLDALRKQYLRNVSHEFRTPLTVIRGWAEYLRDAGPQPETTMRDVMRTILESSDRVIDMVDTLIEVSRVEQDDAAQTLDLRELEMRELVHGALEPLQPVAQRKGIDLRVELPDEATSLVGDAALLVQLVRKLTENAVKYSRDGDRIALRVCADAGCLRVEVSDDGPGIEPGHLPHIFEKFYMADGGISRRTGGTGVGLYLAREVARLHGGDIEVRSEPGRGSVFTVRLPRGGAVRAAGA